MHKNKGKTIAQCLRDRTAYAKNPEKTDGGELVSAFACEPRTMDEEFLLTKREYKTLTGRAQERDVIAYQVRQSFKPGEITPEEANRIGYEFASRFLKDNHAFIVATHIDKLHIHNHIIWNSTSLDCTRKFRNFWGSTKAVHRLSDMICVEHGMSIIENPKKGKEMHYGQWLGDQKTPSHRDRLRAAIDAAIAQKPADIDALLERLREDGYEIKTGKQPAFRGKDQKRPIRLDTLGAGYTMDDLLSVLAGEKTHAPQKRITPVKSIPEINLLVDIQQKLQAGKGAGYERWAKVFNLKQMAQTMNYLMEHGLTDYNELCEKSSAATDRFHALSKQIKTCEKRIAEIAVLRTHIQNYIKTRDTYTDYRKAGYSAKFRAGHESEILLHQAAKRAFDELGVKNLPTVKSLNAEYAELLSEKKAAYVEYRQARNEMRELLTVKTNVDQLLDEKPRIAEKEKTRG
jgi:hypothetical protein